jgi:hypothetical protein
MSTSLVSSSLGMSPCFASLPEEVIRYIVLHLPNHSICCASQVSKLWSQALNSDAFWRALTEKRFFEVEQIDETTPKQVFLELNSMTTFGREKVEEVFGKIRDPIPVLSGGGFTLLSLNDLFDKKKIKENHCLVLKPPRVFLPFKQEFFDLLLQSKDSRDFPSISSHYGDEMEIPLTLTNMKKIYEYRHSEHPNGSAFATELFFVGVDWLNDSEELEEGATDMYEAEEEQFYELKALEQCNQSSEETSIWLIRKEPTLYKTGLATQDEVIKYCELNVVPADIVVEANAICNYQTGRFLSIDLDTYLDACKEARTADRIFFGNSQNAGSAGVRGWRDDGIRGLHYRYEHFDDVDEWLGILPGIRVDVWETPDSSKGSGP